MNIYFLGGHAGTGKSYLAIKLAAVTDGVQYLDLLNCEAPIIDSAAVTLIVDHVQTDDEFASICKFAKGSEIQNLIIVGQNSRGYKADFKGELTLQGKPGERIFEIRSTERTAKVFEKSLENFNQLLH